MVSNTDVEYEANSLFGLTGTSNQIMAGLPTRTITIRPSNASKNLLQEIGHDQVEIILVVQTNYGLKLHEEKLIWQRN